MGVCYQQLTLMTEHRFILLSKAVGATRLASTFVVEAGLLRTIEPAAGGRAALYAFTPLLDVLKV